MSQNYPVPEPEPDFGDPWNPDEQNEAPSPNVGAQFIAPDLPDEPDAPDAPNDQRPGETASAEQTYSSSPTSEAELPPEAQGEANGGPLGCCLGVVMGAVLSLTLAVFGRLYLANPLADVLHNPLLVLILLRIAMAIFTLAAAILCGYFGWKLGKRLFREYEPPVVPERQSRKRKRHKASARHSEA